MCINIFLVSLGAALERGECDLNYRHMMLPTKKRKKPILTRLSLKPLTYLKVDYKDDLITFNYTFFDKRRVSLSY